MIGHGGYFGDNDSPECVGGCGVNAHEFHLQELRGVFGDFNLETFFESGEVENFLVQFILYYFFLLEFQYFFWLHQQL